MTGLKLVYGGSIPSFLVIFGQGQRLVLQMCGKEGGTRVAIPCLLMLILQKELLVWW